MKPRWKKGVVLLQTLVMAIILSMIAVMVMKWILARYMLAARNYRSSEARAHTEYMNMLYSNWNSDFSSIPSNGSILIDRRRLKYYRGVDSSFIVTVDPDTYE